MYVNAFLTRFFLIVDREKQWTMEKGKRGFRKRRMGSIESFMGQQTSLRTPSLTSLLNFSGANNT